MYCSNCGSQINLELNYCSRCGTKVSKAVAEMQNSVSANRASSLGYIGGFGLLGFIIVVISLVKKGVTGPDLIFISFFYLAALAGICFIILRQIKGFSEKPSFKKSDFQSGFQPDQIGAANTAQLEEPKQTPIGVTENTTRNFEKIPLKN